MKFGHLEQKLELSYQNMCKKILKNNAHKLEYLHANFQLPVLADSASGPDPFESTRIMDRKPSQN
jgi:hypothetical protein